MLRFHAAVKSIFSCEKPRGSIFKFFTNSESMSEKQIFTRILLDHSRNKIVFTLLLLSAISCCLYIDSIYIQLPYLVPYPPEGWDLGAFTAVLNGIGKLSLFATRLAIKFGLRNTLHVCNLLGVIIGTSLIFMWDKTEPNSLFDYNLSIGFINSYWTSVWNRFLEVNCVSDALGTILPEAVSVSCARRPSFQWSCYNYHVMSTRVSRGF